MRPYCQEHARLELMSHICSRIFWGPAAPEDYHEPHRALCHGILQGEAPFNLMQDDCVTAEAVCIYKSTQGSF